ncbi:MAG TPA: DUF6248 family natural product biosynthesis protein [Streptosporangiaceae bacterium]|jgi:hypothetical protein|nr:DUF6248 family natural product biosynthesis protein [Streptosporangiaceae bacterium]
MTPDQAAWVREHAWTGTMRKEFREVPQAYSICPCQAGPSTWCKTGQCGRCLRSAPIDIYATVIVSPAGYHPAVFAGPYEHPTTDAVGPKYPRIAMVWLADRVCRWVCPHACHSAPVRPEQLGLFRGGARLMATTRQVEAAAATPKKPVVGGAAVEGHHILAGVTIRPEDRPRVDRELALAARFAVRNARTPDDPDADFVLEVLGLTHDDANPGPPPRPAAPAPPGSDPEPAGPPTAAEREWITAIQACETHAELNEVAHHLTEAGYAASPLPAASGSSPVAAAFMARHRLLVATENAYPHHNNSSKEPTGAGRNSA